MKRWQWSVVAFFNAEGAEDFAKGAKEKNNSDERRREGAILDGEGLAALTAAALSLRESASRTNPHIVALGR